MSLLVFDIDYFKRINDEFGHHVGDQALQQLARLAQQSLRPADLLGRFGGDEFVVLLPNTAIAAAQHIAERIIEQLQQVYIADVHQLTASFGVAELRTDEDYEQLFRRADRALYQAKLAGRNRACLAAD
ncbi:MAG: GGDEF domain-containing protein [Rheinheimera sp.]|nr:GGDEF domain-containing protein [Rheinheimera sp.]